MRACKDDIQLFQAPALRLREEEVYRRNDGGAEDGKHGVSVVAEIVERGRRDHDNQEVTQPVGAGRQGVGLNSDSQICDLGRVQPCHSEPACSPIVSCDLAQERERGSYRWQRRC